MSVPAERMAPRNPAMPMKDPNKIMGLDKKVFYVVVVLGLLLAYYIYRKSQSSSSALNSADAGTTEGVTAADIGGTPADNSFATQTDADALESQIQALEASQAQLAAGNPGSTTGAGVDPNSAADNSSATAATWSTDVNPTQIQQDLALIGSVAGSGSLLPTNPSGNTYNPPPAGPKVAT